MYSPLPTPSPGLVLQTANLQLMSSPLHKGCTSRAREWTAGQRERQERGRQERGLLEGEGGNGIFMVSFLSHKSPQSHSL